MSKYICGECGAQLTYPDIHAKWHRDLDDRLEQVTSAAPPSRAPEGIPPE